MKIQISDLILKNEVQDPVEKIELLIVFKK